MKDLSLALFRNSVTRQADEHLPIREDGALRCHFNLVCAHQTLVDQEGVEVADVDQARTLAIEVALDMIRTGEAQITDWRGWRLEATSGSGAVLFTLSLDALLS